jgi:hypothetical protein
MEFLYPGFLWALLAVSVPILIHLFYFRRFRKVYFSNIKFLKEIKEETTNTNKLKNLLILLSRILAIIFLVFAFSRPFIPAGDQISKGSAAVSIYIDNSFSMQALSEDVSLIEKAKKIARELVEGYPDNAGFQVVTNELFGEDLRWTDKKDAIEKINSIELNPIVQNISNVLNRQTQAFSNIGAENRHVYWISDFQTGVFDTSPESIDTATNYYAVILQAVREKNLSIDSIYWDQPLILKDYINKLFVQISNNSVQDAKDIPLSIEYNGEIMPLGKFNIRAASTETAEVDIRIKDLGWNTGKVSIKDYPMVFDDDYYFAFNVPATINVLNINHGKGPSRQLRTAFASEKFFNYSYSDINQVDYSTLIDYQLIILEDIVSISTGLASTLINSMKNGVTVMLFPGKNADLASVNSFLQDAGANVLMEYQEGQFEANRINLNEFVLRNVFDKTSDEIPPIAVKGKYKSSEIQTRNKFNLIQFRNGESFMSRYESGNGHLFLSSSPFSPDINDLSKSPDIFIPIMFRMSIAGQGYEEMAYTIGEDKVIQLPRLNLARDSYLKIFGHDQEFIPKQIITPGGLLLDEGGNIRKSGIYSVIYNDSLISKVAYNYSRMESKLDYLNAQQISAMMNDNIEIYDRMKNNFDFTKQVVAKQKGTELWKYALLLVLLFLAIEIILIRFWKK